MVEKLDKLHMISYCMKDDGFLNSMLLLVGIVWFASGVLDF